MANILLFQLPLMALTNDHVVVWSSWWFRLDMNDSQSCFFCCDDESFFIPSSAFFQAALLSDNNGEQRHSLSASFTFFTAVLQFEFHHGRRGSFGGESNGTGFLKFL